MKRRAWSLVICTTLLFLNGCSVMAEDIKKDLEWTKENQIAGEHYNEAVVDGLLDILDTDSESSQSDTKENETSAGKTCGIGDCVKMETPDGEAINVTILDWGSAYDDIYGNLVYIYYEIENIGELPVTVGNGMFNVYADDYAMQQFVLAEDAIVSAEISGGRKIAGSVYVEANSDSISKLEIECGNVVWLLKEPVKAIKSSEIPEDLIRDEQPLDTLDMSGEYSSVGDGYASISMYSSVDDEYLGNIDIQFGWSLSGNLIQIDTNVYQVINSEGLIVLIGMYTDNGNVFFDLFINGEREDLFTMISPYVS